MKTPINLEQQDNLSYKAFWENGVFIGDILKDVDGYFKFWPRTDLYGHYDELFLVSMFKTLEKLNAKWDKEIDDFFGLGSNDVEQGKSV